jgi:tetratricopeptide (TPR) repeat protein
VARFRCVVILTLALALAGGRAWGEARTERAREHYLQGDAYYKLDKYAEALHEYEQAYIAKPDPSFLYNIAQCHRLTGNRADALKFYRRYLRDAPGAPNRAIAEKHIRELEAALAHASERADEPARADTGTSSMPASTPTPTPPPTSEPMPMPMPMPPPTLTLPPARAADPHPTTLAVTESAAPSNADQEGARPFYTKWWFWTAVGVAVGGTLLLVAASGHDPRCPQGSICK